MFEKVAMIASLSPRNLTDIGTPLVVDLETELLVVEGAVKKGSKRFAETDFCEKVKSKTARSSVIGNFFIPHDIVREL